MSAQTYRSRTTLEAMQWTGENFVEVSQWLGQWPLGDIARHGTTLIVGHPDYEHWRVQLGEWMVEDEDHERIHITDSEDFVARFERAVSTVADRVDVDALALIQRIGGYLSSKGAANAAADCVRVRDALRSLQEERDAQRPVVEAARKALPWVGHSPSSVDLSAALRALDSLPAPSTEGRGGDATVKADPDESCPAFQTPFDGSDLCNECGVEEADHR